MFVQELVLFWKLVSLWEYTHLEKILVPSQCFRSKHVCTSTGTVMSTNICTNIRTIVKMYNVVVKSFCCLRLCFCTNKN